MVLKVTRAGNRVWSHLTREKMESHQRRGSMAHFGVDKGAGKEGRVRPQFFVFFFK